MTTSGPSQQSPSNQIPAIQKAETRGGPDLQIQQEPLVDLAAAAVMNADSYREQNDADISSPTAGQNLIDVCTTLGWKFSDAEIDRWFEIITELGSDAARDDCFNEEAGRESLRSRIEQETGNSFLGAVVTGLASELKHSSHKEKDRIRTVLKSALAEIDIVPRERMSDCIPSTGFEDRRTNMNTGYQRMLYLDQPVLRYLDRHPSRTPLVLVDLGVGFPPVTTTSTAEIVAGRAAVIGVDTTIPDLEIIFSLSKDRFYLVLYELNEVENRFVPILVQQSNDEHITGYYFLYRTPSGDELEYALRKSEQIRKGLMAGDTEDLYLDMARLLHSSPSEREMENLHHFYECSNVPGKLVFDPFRRFSHPNLVLRKDDFRLQTVQEANIIRLGNVLWDSYYSQEEADAALKLLSGKLPEGGIIIVANEESCSVVFEKEDGSLVPSLCTLIYSQGKASPVFKFAGSEPFIRAMSEVAASACSDVDAITVFERHGFRAALVQAFDLNFIEIDLRCGKGCSHPQPLNKEDAPKLLPHSVAGFLNRLRRVRRTGRQEEERDRT